MMTIPLLYFVFSFLRYEVSYSKKNMKNFRTNTEFVFAIGLQTVIFGTYFCD